MKVLSYELNAPDCEYGKMIDMENRLDVHQKYVDGWIEVLTLPNGCVAVFNEEGVIRGLEPNATITLEQGFHLIHGNFFICGKEGVEFSDIDVTKIDEIEKLIKRVGTN